MKKSLVLAMAMALGVTASAYAANPFSDVPAGHWAYDSISKLAAAGVIEGYGDATFGGDKLMTRYEMAQITAKAMAKGANCDKLAAEFADELDNLGVRVANLEKKADNVKITGQIRAHYRDLDRGTSVSKLRTRLFVNGQINEDWSYTGRLQNEQEITGSNEGEDKDVKLNWAFVTGKVGGMAVTAGRQNVKLNNGSVIDIEMDAVKASYGKAVKVTGVAAKAVDKVHNITGANQPEKDRFYAVDVATKLGAVDAFATYYKVDDKDQEIYDIGAALTVAKDLKLKAEYLRGDFENSKLDNNGYVIGLAYKGAKASAVGSYGLWATYYDQPAATYLKPTVSGYAANATVGTDKLVLTRNFEGTDGFKGFEVGANYAVAKNIVAAVRYYDLESREGEADEKTLWSEVVFTF